MRVTRHTRKPIRRHPAMWVPMEEKRTMNEFSVIVGDCREKMSEVGTVDYIFTGPPDFDEVGLNPKSTKDYIAYYALLKRAFDEMVHVTPVITVAITDRKCDGEIIPKHAIVQDLLRTHGWRCISHKIWSKSMKRNLYRLTYTHIMSFAKGTVKQNHPNVYEIDVLHAKEQKWQGYSYGINEEVVWPFILNFTNEGDTVLDPFLGSGTTAVVCLQNNRNCIGIEICSVTAEIAQKRVSSQGRIPRARKFFEERENFD